MKQQIIELKKKLLLVGLPEDATRNEIEFDNMVHIGSKYLVYPFKYGCIKVPVNKCLELSKIGKLTDIKEEQFHQLVENIKAESTRYINYKESVICNNCFDTAKESFFSKLEADGVYFENPIGEFPTKYNTGLEYGMQSIALVGNWEEAQEKVWNINNTYLFEILN